MARVRDQAVALLWLTVLGASVAGLHALQPTGAAPPASPSPAAWLAWGTSVAPPDAAFALLRLLVLTVGWYLAGATALQLLAGLVRSVPLVRMADLVTLPALRPVLHRAVGLALATSSAVTSVPATAWAQSAPPAPATETATEAVGDPLWHLDAPAGTGTSDEATRPPAPGPSGETGEVVGEREPEGQLPTTAGSATPGEPATPGEVVTLDALLTIEEQHSPGPRATAPAAEAADDTWLVQPGDHLWHIAEHVLADHLGRDASDAEVVPYWQRLIEVNRDRLVHRDDPDLILPGQRFVLPPVA